MKPIEKAINHFGGLAKFSRALGVKPPSALSWRDSNKPLPILRCVQIEQATNGLVTRKDLRPNDWHLIWPELAETQTKEPQ